MYLLFAGIILFIFLVYMLIPNIYARKFSKNVLKKISVSGKKEIALTFDDGPNPEITSLLLDLLKENQVKASFFLVAQRAAQNPEIVKRMKNEGHTIGLHSYRHKGAWESLPFQTLKDFSNSIREFNKLGLSPVFFRPPWGTFNLISLLAVKKHHLISVFWTVEARDWEVSATSALIEERLLERTSRGDIIVLHDRGGAEGSPQKTLEALKTGLIKLKERGFTFVSLDQQKEGFYGKYTG